MDNQLTKNSNGSSQPIPDPTVATNDAVARGDKSERDYVDGQLAIRDERLRGIDRATELLSQTVNRVPSEVTKEITHLHGLMMEKFKSVATQFTERDTRSERESKDNKVAVDAAFAAQKEAAAKQDESNQKAIDKSEKVVTDAINKLQDSFKTSNDNLQGQINDLKLSQGRVDATKAGATENRTENRDSRAGVYAAIGIGITVLLALMAVATFIIARSAGK